MTVHALSYYFGKYNISRLEPLRTETFANNQLFPTRGPDRLPNGMILRQSKVARSYYSSREEEVRASDLGSFENQARGLILSLSCVNLLRSFVSITNLMAKLIEVLLSLQIQRTLATFCSLEVDEEYNKLFILQSKATRDLQQLAQILSRIS